MYFENIENSKWDIYDKLRKKSGVYMFINNLNKGTYLGSNLN